MEKTFEKLYQEHLNKEPERIVRLGEFEVESREYIRWKIEKDNLDSVKNIPQETRQKILDYFRKGNTIGMTAKHFKVDSMGVANLIHYNLIQVFSLNEVSI